MSSSNAPVLTLQSPPEGSLDKRLQVRRMFSAIAPSYDRVNQIISLRGHRRWREQAVRALNLSPGAKALDLCCGTGDFVSPLRSAVGLDGVVIGMDFALPMLSLAVKKTKNEARYVAADSLRVPCGADQFDGITVGWGVRNVTDIDAFHREVVRLLKPGGRFVSVDTAVPENPVVRFASRLLFKTFVPLVGWLMGHLEAYRYLPESTERFSSRRGLKDSMERAGMVDVRFEDKMGGNICMHFGRKP
jgi:demethylmenaquinone methyltransferase/2-methoxy-6-polyprenyl-1,4-benzoquinol methylase